MKQMNRWFTRYLHDVQNDVENEPKAWIVRPLRACARITATFSRSATLLQRRQSCLGGTCGDSLMRIDGQTEGNRSLVP